MRGDMNKLSPSCCWILFPHSAILPFEQIVFHCTNDVPHPTVPGTPPGRLQGVKKDEQQNLPLAIHGHADRGIAAFLSRRNR